jgi:hypothetical protein
MAVAVALVVQTAPVRAIVYVDRDAAGANDGSSWADAFTDLQNALLATASGEIWVAEGTYTPAGPDGDRWATFALASGVALYGGFTGVEISRDQGDPATHRTVLSGDLNGNDGPGWTNMEENSYHVVTASGTDSTAVLDGFLITRGRATDSAWPGGHAAGIRIENASPVIAGCTVKENISGNGSGVAIAGGSPRFLRSTFEGNYTSYGRGGAVHSGANSHPRFADCVFSGNTATTGGNLGYAGAIYADLNSTLHVVRSTFIGNTTTFGCCGGIAPAEGGAIVILGDGSWIEDSVFLDNWAHDAGAVYVLGNTTFVNCTFSGNTAVDPEIVQGG